MSAPARRALVREAVARGVSLRRACALLAVARSTVEYVPQRARTDAALTRLLQQVARQYPRFGYRRAWAWLRRQGYRVNAKRVYRLWRAAGLALPRRRGRRRAASGQRRAPVARRPNAVWATDIVHDRCASGAVIRCLTVVDEYTRECLAAEVADRISSATVVRCLAALAARHGPPRYVRMDNGPEFIARRTQAWLATQRILPAYIQPGSPWQNGVVESFHSRLRDECLDREWFASRTEAAVLIAAYRRRYNRTHLHSRLGYRTPAEVRADYDTRRDTAALQRARRAVSQ